MSDTIESVKHVTLWNLDSFSSHLHYCGPLHLAFPLDVAYACFKIQQVAKEEEEDERIFYRVSGYWRVSDIMEVDITEFRM